MNQPNGEQPAACISNVPTGRQSLRRDAIAGFLVFLVALPLCLAIARASGFPPIAGVWTAVIGGIVCSFLGSSQLTIKGPAAGMIVIVLGAVTDLGAEFGAGLSDTEKMLLGYKLALGVGVVAALIQIVFGICRVGKWVDFFPLTPVHGMLAAIGLIIIAKQAYEVIGVAAVKGAEPLELLTDFPHALAQTNPGIALIGVVSLVILFGFPYVRGEKLKAIPAQFVVLVVALCMGIFMDLDQWHSYRFPVGLPGGMAGKEFELGPRFLVDIPAVLQDPLKAFVFPDFRGVGTQTGIQYIVLFSLVGSLESLLSARAIELIDPWKRKTNYNRELVAVGSANFLASMIGGLPMIAEIVRSKANVDSGGRTKNANLFHGLFLLAFVLFIPGLIQKIPLAALGAMLVYTGFRLANPNEFVRVFRVGGEQFAVFLITIVATLATDLLIGVGIGIAAKIAIHLWNGCPIRSIFKADVQGIQQDEHHMVLVVRDAAIFSNWLGLSRVIQQNVDQYDSVVVDLSRTRLVDHTVMDKLHHFVDDAKRNGKELTVVGLDRHSSLSNHPLSARKGQAKQSIGIGA
jgi:MFS superfamily sulfate permease-like transporter